MTTYLVCIAATAALNLAAAWWNSAAEKKLEETSPRFKAFVDALSAVGIDPVKLCAAVATMIKGKK